MEWPASEVWRGNGSSERRTGRRRARRFSHFLPVGRQGDRIAVGHFNFSDTVTFNAISAAARELNLPVIVGVSEGAGLSVLAAAKIRDFESLTRHQARAASESPVASSSTARRSLSRAAPKSRFFRSASPIFSEILASSLRISTGDAALTGSTSAHEAAADYFHTTLTTSKDPAAQTARDYLKGRGFGSEVAKRFRLGYATGGKSGLVARKIAATLSSISRLVSSSTTVTSAPIRSAVRAESMAAFPPPITITLGLLAILAKLSC